MTDNEPTTGNPFAKTFTSTPCLAGEHHECEGCDNCECHEGAQGVAA